MRKLLNVEVDYDERTKSYTIISRIPNVTYCSLLYKGTDEKAAMTTIDNIYKMRQAQLFREFQQQRNIICKLTKENQKI